jgi:hypothetical protein
MNRRPAWNSVVVTVVLLAICAAVGMVALPLVCGPTPGGVTTLVWLVAAAILSVLAIVLTLQLSAPIASGLGRALGASSITPSQTRLLARLSTFGLALVITQAILRRPVALIIGGDASAVSIESGIAAAALSGVLVTLVWVYQTARPMVQAATLRAIDAAVPTTGQALMAEPTRTSVSVVSGGPVPAPTDAVTVVAPLFVVPRGTGTPTLVAGQADDATVLANQNTDATVVTHRDAEATVVAKRPENDSTILAEGPDDPTLSVHGA